MEKTIELIIPDSLAEVSIATAYVVERVIKLENVSDFEKVVQMVAAINGITVEEVRKIPMSVVDEIGAEMIKLFTFNDEDIHLDDYRFVEIDGVRYALEPDFNKIEVGAYMDISDILEDLDYNLHKLMAILYRPIDTTYKNTYRLTPYSTEPDEELKERQNLFLHKMPYATVRAIVNFILSRIEN